MSEFRKGIDYIGVTCVFYCHDGQGNFLLHQRSENCKDEQGTWDCGGGGLEVGETFEEGVRREVLEEYCAPISDLRFAGVVNVLRNNREGLRTHWIALVYAAQVDPKQVELGDPKKMDAIGWFNPDNFPEPRHSMLMSHFELAQKVLNPK